MSKFGTVGVSGQSMQPTFSDGDWLCVRWLKGQTSALERGAIVVIEREERPGIFLVKRIQKFHSGRYWVEGDSTESTDSRQWGWISPHEIRGKVLFRYWRSKK
jgi:nickel-type superoxide dismutase maturation protease